MGLAVKKLHLSCKWICCQDERSSGFHDVSPNRYHARSLFKKVRLFIPTKPGGFVLIGSGMRFPVWDSRKANIEQRDNMILLSDAKPTFDLWIVSRALGTP